MEKVKKYVYGLDRILGYISCVMVFLCMLLVTVSVLVRLFKIGSIPGMTDYCGFLMAMIVACSVPWVEMNHGHIRVDFIVEFLPRKISTLILSIVDILGILVIGIICWQLLHYGINCYKVGTTTWVAFIPYWPFVFLSSIGFLAYLITAIVNYADRIITTVQAEKKGGSAK